MPRAPRFSFRTLLLTCSILGVSLQAHAAEVEQLCDNEWQCIESMHEENRYDPIDFAELKLIVGGEDSLSFNDNIYRSPMNEESDIINRFSPRVALESNLDQHYWQVELEAENGIYFQNEENNYTDFSALAEGRYDVNPHASIYAGGGYILDHVGIGSFVDDPGAGDAEPTTYHNFLAHIGMDYRPASGWHVEPRLHAQDYNFENADRRGGGVNIQDDRDRTEYGAALTVGKAIHANDEVYVRAAVEAWEHDERIDSSALSTRDSTQQRYWIGYRNDEALAPGFTFDVAAGVLDQGYEAGRLPDVTALDVHADAKWKIDRANSLRLRAYREVRDAYSNRYSAYLRSRARLNYEHAFTDLLSVGAGASYTNDDFETIASASPIKREDDIYGMHLWGAYEFYENIEASLYYDYSDRDSNDPEANFDANVVGIVVSYKH